MNGEIDLELYTISIVRLNIAFQKLEDNDDDASTLFEKSADDLEEFYLDVVNDLNQKEIDYNEFCPFLKMENYDFRNTSMPSKKLTPNRITMI